MVRKFLGSTFKPRRKKELLVEDLDGEILVYDLARHCGHCITPEGARVWGYCDGKRSVAQVITALHREGHIMEEATVWRVLEELNTARLLETFPKRRSVNRSRRNLLKAAAVAAPFVCSIVAPTAAEAASVACTMSTMCNAADPNVCCGSTGQPAMSCSGSMACAGSGPACTPNTCN